MKNKSGLWYTLAMGPKKRYLNRADYINYLSRCSKDVCDMKCDHVSGHLTKSVGNMLTGLNWAAEVEPTANGKKRKSEKK